MAEAPNIMVIESHLGNEHRLHVVAARLREFCDARRDRISRCLLCRPIDGLYAIIGTGNRPYDFALGEEIAALERTLSDEGHPVSVLQCAGDVIEDIRHFGLLSAHAAREGGG